MPITLPSATTRSGMTVSSITAAVGCWRCGPWRQSRAGICRAMCAKCHFHHSQRLRGRPAARAGVHAAAVGAHPGRERGGVDRRTALTSSAQARTGAGAGAAASHGTHQRPAQSAAEVRAAGAGVGVAARTPRKPSMKRKGRDQRPSGFSQLTHGGG